MFFFNIAKKVLYFVANKKKLRPLTISFFYRNIQQTNSITLFDGSSNSSRQKLCRFAKKNASNKNVCNFFFIFGVFGFMFLVSTYLHLYIYFYIGKTEQRNLKHRCRWTSAVFKSIAFWQFQNFLCNRNLICLLLLVVFSLSLSPSFRVPLVFILDSFLHQLRYTYSLIIIALCTDLLYIEFDWRQNRCFISK